MSSATMRDAIALSLRYQDLIFTLARCDLLLRDQMTFVRADVTALPETIQAFVVDHLIASMWSALKQLGGLPEHARIETTRPRPPDANAYNRVLGVAPRFGAAENLIGFDDAFLDAPRPAVAASTLEICERQCAELLARRRAQIGAAGVVRQRLSRATGVLPGMAMVATDLNVSIRTLHRALSAGHTNFRALTEQVRHERAETLLATPSMKLREIATDLGYASTASFSRAFRHAHGLAPGAWRRQHAPPPRR